MKSKEFQTNSIPPYLLDLLTRIADPTGTVLDPLRNNESSGPTISEIALKEASTLSDLNHVTYLQEIFNQPSKFSDVPWVKTDMRLRESAYDVLAYVYSNTKEKYILEWMISQLMVQKSRWMLFHMLSVLSSDLNFLKPGIPADINIDNILNLVDHKNHLVRDEAIICLENTNNQKAEDKLIEVILQPDQNPYAYRALDKIGTRKSIPVLMKIAESQKDRITESVMRTMLSISDERDLPFFVNALVKNKYKMNALEGVLKYGDKSTVPVVENRIKQFISRKRKIEIALWGWDKTDLTQAMEFLVKYKDECPSVKKLYTLLVTKKKDMLFGTEQEWLKNNEARFI